MPLTGAGPILGPALMLAIGNTDPAAAGPFASVASTVATWTVANTSCMPGTMVAAGSAVAGVGLVRVKGEASDLGQQLATALGLPPDDESWQKFAAAYVAQLSLATVNPSGFAIASPITGGPLAGAGLLTLSLAFTPLLALQLGVSDPVAGAMLEVFGTQILAFVQTNALVAPIATSAPFIPFTAPPGGGPILGAGSIT